MWSGEERGKSGESDRARLVGEDESGRGVKGVRVVPVPSEARYAAKLDAIVGGEGVGR